MSLKQHGIRSGCIDGPRQMTLGRHLVCMYTYTHIYIYIHSSVILSSRWCISHVQVYPQYESIHLIRLVCLDRTSNVQSGAEVYNTEYFGTVREVCLYHLLYLGKKHSRAPPHA